MAEFNEHDGRGGRERGRGGRDMRRPNRDEQREERRREAARHTGLMKAAFGRETDEAIETARIYEDGEGRGGRSGRRGGETRGGNGRGGCRWRPSGQ